MPRTAASSFSGGTGNSTYRPGMPYCASQWLWMTGERECATGQPSRPAMPN